MKSILSLITVYTLTLLIAGAMILNSAAPKLQAIVTALEVVK